MSFFKRLFGTSDSKGQSERGNQGDRLGMYKDVPWMTDLRLENISICLNAGFIPGRSLPTDMERELRPKDEIAKRLHAIKAIALWLALSEEQNPSDQILRFIEENDLNSFLSEAEREVFKHPRNDGEMKSWVGWKFENAWPLAWYFGYQEPEITFEMIDVLPMYQILMEFTCPPDQKLEDWMAGKKTVAEEELRKKEDLYYCLHNAARSGQMGQQSVPRNFEPEIHGGVIHERRHAFTWMLSKGTEWDDTDLST